MNHGLVGRTLATLATVALVGSACTADDPDPNVAVVSPGGSSKVVMSEFAFLPSDLTVTAGSTVTLALVNEGGSAHEFMVGQDPAADGGYLDDFLVRIVTSADGTRFETAGMTLDEHDDDAGAGGHDEDVPAEDDAEEPMSDEDMADMADTADVEDMGGEGGHAGHAGAAVTVQPGGQAQLVLDIPIDAVGAWEIGCFITGHYEAGMHAILTVLPATS